MFNHPFPTNQNNNIIILKVMWNSSLMKSILKDADIIIPLLIVEAPICNKYPKGLRK